MSVKLEVTVQCTYNIHNSMPLWVVSSTGTLLLTLFTQPQILGSFLCSSDVDPVGEIHSIHWACDIELSSKLSLSLSLSGICLHSSFKSKLETHLFSTAY